MSTDRRRRETLAPGSMAIQGINQRIADRLLAEGRILKADHNRAVEYATRNRGRIEDALIELEIFPEGDLLKYIATLFGTRFVSTERLAKAGIDTKVVGKVSPKTADLHGVFPVLFDEANKVLSVVTADPDNDVALHEIKMAAGVREVKALVARPAAVRAAIAHHYFRDLGAFNALLRPISSITELANADPFRPRARTGHSYVPPAVAPNDALDPVTVNRAQYGSAPGVVSQSQAPYPPAPPAAYGQSAPPQYAASTPAPGPAMNARATNPFATQPQWATPVPVQPVAPAQPAWPTPAPPVAAVAVPVQQLAPAMPVAPPAAAPIVPMSAPPSPVAPPPPVTSTPEFLETLNVLVSLLENSRQDLRGHSSTVARLVKKTCERIGLAPALANSIVLAAYLHDLGKMGTYHLTPFNVAEYEGHRIAATKGVELPAHLMASVQLAPETTQAITSMYERFDGHGFPNGQAGKEIPLGARILAVADTYADLTQNPRNPYRKVLRPFEACEVLAQYKGTVFDPNIVDLFRQAMTGDDIRAKLLADRYLALIVDPDPEETTVLELRLIEQGFEVKIARTAAQAQRDLEAGDVSVVVSEIDLDEADAGLALRGEAQRAAWGRDLTWVVLTSKADRQSAQRAFDLGVDDFVSKPASTEIFVAKLRQLIERRATRTAPRGVSGSLAEMGLPDMIQILWHGRKTCALKINARGTAGEIHFAEGQVVDALYGQLRGEAAFYKMLTLHEGDFRLDPTFVPSVRSITASPEALLLEGMRRLDEDSAARG
jgi:response regulator RpfG family c-di-GMP phosphodiesterase